MHLIPLHARNMKYREYICTCCFMMFHDFLLHVQVFNTQHDDALQAKAIQQIMEATDHYMVIGASRDAAKQDLRRLYLKLSVSILKLRYAKCGWTSTKWYSIACVWKLANHLGHPGASCACGRVLCLIISAFLILFPWSSPMKKANSLMVSCDVLCLHRV